MSQALRNIAMHPDCIAPLRKEIEEITRHGGWTKTSIDKMYKLDSFLRETMRLDASALSSDFPTCMFAFDKPFWNQPLISSYHQVTMPRKCLRAMTFSDGTTVPQGALLFVGSQVLHTDARHYARPESFDPFRFVSSQVDDRQELSTSHSYSGFSSSGSTFLPASLTLPATSPTFLAWGHGKHACPGRFLAASVMKLVLARFVYEFDIRPPAICVDDSKVGTNEMLWIELRRRQRWGAWNSGRICCIW